MKVDIKRGCLPELEFSPLPACLLVGGSILERKVLSAIRKEKWWYTWQYDLLWDIRMLKGSGDINKIHFIKKLLLDLGNNISIRDIRDHLLGLRIIIDNRPAYDNTGFWGISAVMRYHKLNDYHESAKRCYGYWEAIFSSITEAMKAANIYTKAKRESIRTSTGEMAYFYIFPDGRKFVDNSCLASVSHITNFVNYNKKYNKNDRST